MPHMVLICLSSIVSMPSLPTTTGHNMQLAGNRIRGIEADCFWSDYGYPSQTEDGIDTSQLHDLQSKFSLSCNG